MTSARQRYRELAVLLDLLRSGRLEWVEGSVPNNLAREADILEEMGRRWGEMTDEERDRWDT